MGINWLYSCIEKKPGLNIYQNINQREIRQHFTSKRCFLGIKSHISDTRSLIPLYLQSQHNYESVSWTLSWLGQSTLEPIFLILFLSATQHLGWMDLKSDSVYTVVTLSQIKGCCLQIPGENRNITVNDSVPEHACLGMTAATCAISVHYFSD